MRASSVVAHVHSTKFDDDLLKCCLFILGSAWGEEKRRQGKRGEESRGKGDKKREDERRKEEATRREERRCEEKRGEEMSALEACWGPLGGILGGLGGYLGGYVGLCWAIWEHLNGILGAS